MPGQSAPSCESTSCTFWLPVGFLLQHCHAFSPPFKSYPSFNEPVHVPHLQKVPMPTPAHAEHLLKVKEAPNWRPCFLSPATAWSPPISPRGGLSTESRPGPLGLTLTPQQAQEEGLPPSGLCPYLQPHLPSRPPTTLAPCLSNTSSLCLSLHLLFLLPGTLLHRPVLG